MVRNPVVWGEQGTAKNTVCVCGLSRGTIANHLLSKEGSTKNSHGDGGA